MGWEYRMIEGVTRHIEEQLREATSQGWEPYLMSTVPQPHAMGGILVHTTILLRREAQAQPQAPPAPAAAVPQPVPTPAAPSAPGAPPPPPVAGPPPPPPVPPSR
jgi:hypothetical protein